MITPTISRGDRQTIREGDPFQREAIYAVAGRSGVAHRIEPLPLRAGRHVRHVPTLPLSAIRGQAPNFTISYHSRCSRQK